MPVNYQGGKIYTIRAPETDKYYIGSTVDSLPKRFYAHKASFARYQNGKMNKVTSFQILELEGAYIELLELYPCNSKAELERREGELIREHKDNCVNRNIAGRTRKEYREANKDKIKQHYEVNKETIRAKASEKMQCECGASIRRDYLTKCRKTAIHTKRLFNIQKAEKLENQKVEQAEKADELKKQKAEKLEKQKVEQAEKAEKLEKLLKETIPAEQLPAIMQMINAV